MNDKNKQLNELLISLGEIDEGILDEAYHVNSKEEFDKLKKSKKGMFSVLSGKAFTKITTVAAALLMVCGLAFAIPAFLRDEAPDAPFDYGELPWINGEDGYVKINSIDELNYFAAKRVLSELQSSRSASIQIRPSENASVMMRLSNTKEEESSDNIAYHELDPNEVFTITMVTFFRIELKEEDGFLASKLGTGIVDVVITENSIEDMITFKRGDKYFSCLINGGNSREKDFITSKYIEGFKIVKNYDQQNYRFKITYDGNIVSDIECSYFKSWSGEPEFYPDRASVVPDTTRISNVRASFTIAELEEYFNRGIVPNVTETAPPEELPQSFESIEYSDGTYTFIFDRAENTFVLCKADDNGMALKKGRYSMIDGNAGYLLTFFEDDSTEPVGNSIPLFFNENNGFVYNGSEYLPSEVEVKY